MRGLQQALQLFGFDNTGAKMAHIPTFRDGAVNSIALSLGKAVAVRT
jgi:hypothetical protein